MKMYFTNEKILVAKFWIWEVMNGKWRKYNIWNWKIEKFSIGMLLISDHNLDTRLTNLPICTMYNKWLWKVGIVYASDEDKKFLGFTFNNCKYWF